MVGDATTERTYYNDVCCFGVLPDLLSACQLYTKPKRDDPKVVPWAKSEKNIEKTLRIALEVFQLEDSPSTLERDRHR